MKQTIKFRKLNSCEPEGIISINKCLNQSAEWNYKKFNAYTNIL